MQTTSHIAKRYYILSYVCRPIIHPPRFILPQDRSKSETPLHLSFERIEVPDLHMEHTDSTLLPTTVSNNEDFKSSIYIVQFSKDLQYLI